MRLCKNGFNQARSCSNGRADDHADDDDWGPWTAAAPVDDEKEDDTDEEEVLDYYERWDEDVEEEEGADDGVEVVEVDDDEAEEDDEAKMAAAKVAARFAQSGDEAILNGLCNSLDDQFANRADVCPFHMTHWVPPKGDVALAREQTGLKRRRGTSSRAGRVSQVNGYTWLA